MQGVSTSGLVFIRFYLADLPFRALNVDAFVLLGSENEETVSPNGIGHDRLQYTFEQCRTAAAALPAALEALRITKCRTSISNSSPHSYRRTALGHLLSSHR
jgi:hypothetical protein